MVGPGAERQPTLTLGPVRGSSPASCTVTNAPRWGRGDRFGAVAQLVAHRTGSVGVIARFPLPAWACRVGLEAVVGLAFEWGRLRRAGFRRLERSQRRDGDSRRTV